MPIRISLRCMLMPHCRVLHSVRNTAFGEQAPHGCIPSCLRNAHRNAQIKEYVPEALSKVEHLILAESEPDNVVAFMGTENNRLEMLFLSTTKR